MRRRQRPSAHAAADAADGDAHSTAAATTPAVAAEQADDPADPLQALPPDVLGPGQRLVGARARCGSAGGPGDVEQCHRQRMRDQVAAAPQTIEPEAR
ncbi:hypothetical protein CC117_08785 [Parafrankia colletiae]|uniref:Uncharacterized protein n=1 Tax=Parafrankia colletiae TaxID=573497 RepID=A0A1S1RGI4_9ACTN|nr:hypothetical protein [Parafrankia colletiae]MCK9901731.1 hypothetical protein [Frankia sp. Cpl3]OHV45863.1 hypothetical protein CC117_08785 [Parafrankia colletiae]